nr:tyrosine-type recombinase/integrase [Tissierella pigra]
MIKIQTSYANPAEINKSDVENFRQRILEAGDKRLYAIVTLLSYAGLRISEALNVKLEDLSLDAKELIIRKGKGKKQRVVYLNSKIVYAIKEYLKVRHSESEYLFSSRESDRVDRSVINKQFKKYSNKITPHQLRHFFCTNALESGFAVHEVANLAGHSSIQTTLIYTNPSREKMKSRIEML